MGIYLTRTYHYKYTKNVLTLKIKTSIKNLYFDSCILIMVMAYGGLVRRNACTPEFIIYNDVSCFVEDSRSFARDSISWLMASISAISSRSLSKCPLRCRGLWFFVPFATKKHKSRALSIQK